MPRPRLIVHLGLHKTGTTSIQQYLSDNPYGLYKAGVLYPSTGRHPVAATQHALLANGFHDHPLFGIFALAKPIDTDLVTRALIHEVELSGYGTVVVSAEEMARFDEAAIGRFTSAFSDFDIYPLVFVRNLADLLDAYYSTLIFYSGVTDPPGLNLVQTDLGGPLRTWAAAAADGRICVVDYDASPSGDSVVDFLLACEIDSLALPSPGHSARLNQSASPALVALVRDLRKAGASEEHLEGLRGQLGDVVFSERQTNLSKELADQLQERYERLFYQLRGAPFVRWIGTSALPRARREDAVQIHDLAGAVFALGRAIGADD
ncbi:MAG: hypothetical protein ACT4P1_10295 [Sporichthyaceae bacterium]